jgi:hypothetical protein
MTDEQATQYERIKAAGYRIDTRNGHSVTLIKGVTAVTFPTFDAALRYALERG